MAIFCHDFCRTWIYICNVMIMKEWTSKFFLIQWKLNESINNKTGGYHENFIRNIRIDPVPFASGFCNNYNNYISLLKANLCQVRISDRLSK